MDIAVLQKIAPPGVTILIAFLAYSSQYLFLNIEPHPLLSSEVYIFNGLVICLLISYWRTCFTDPGRIPTNWQELLSSATEGDGKAAQQQAQKQRWCRKCEIYKPARAHHCKTCKRYVYYLNKQAAHGGWLRQPSSIDRSEGVAKREQLHTKDGPSLRLDR